MGALLSVCIFVFGLTQFPPSSSVRSLAVISAAEPSYAGNVVSPNVGDLSNKKQTMLLLRSRVVILLTSGASVLQNFKADRGSRVSRFLPRMIYDYITKSRIKHRVLALEINGALPLRQIARRVTAIDRFDERAHLRPVTPPRTDTNSLHEHARAMRGKEFLLRQPHLLTNENTLHNPNGGERKRKCSVPATTAKRLSFAGASGGENSWSSLTRRGAQAAIMSSAQWRVWSGRSARMRSTAVTVMLLKSSICFGVAPRPARCGADSAMPWTYLRICLRNYVSHQI
jgi:hypothetical protein